jgi:hypothetical protein
MRSTTNENNPVGLG